jgi:hypothetical protein
LKQKVNMKINKKVKFYLLFVLILTISGCMQQESTEMGLSTEVEQVSNLNLSKDVQMIIIQKAISLILPMLVYFELLW